ncbi:site-specific integrase, partial [Nostoc sp. NIES-2111]
LDKIPSEGQRSHSLVLLKSILKFAEVRKLAEVKRIDIAPTKSREVQSFYQPAELALLDRAAADLISERPSLVLSMTAVRLLIATGARLSEVLTLQWSAVDLVHGVLALERDKSSVNRRDILLSPAAVEIIKALPRTSSPFVFPSDSKNGHLGALQKAWQLVVKRAGFRRLRLHDLRHSFASAGIASGLSLFQIGALLGHRQATTTARYSHLQRETSRAALDRISSAIAAPKATEPGK